MDRPSCKMEENVPPGFTTLGAALKQPDVNFSVMGAVTDFMPPTSTRGTDHMCTFNLFDRTLEELYPSLRVKFFHPSPQSLPVIESIGDVVALRNVKVKSYHGESVVLSNHLSEWAVFPVRTMPKKSSPSNVRIRPISSGRLFAPTLAEQQYAITLCKTQDPYRPPTPQHLEAPESRTTTTDTHEPKKHVVAVVPMPRGKFSLVKDLEVDSYCDLVGQVVKSYPAYGGRHGLYVTDYTSNDLLFNYKWGRGGKDREGGLDTRSGHGGDWPGPYGKRTLQITLWDLHADYAQAHVKEQDLVSLKNVKIKFGQDGATLKLEGNIHTHKHSPNRIGVSIIKETGADERVQQVLTRKEDYWKKAKRQQDEFLKDADGPKGQQGDENQPEDGKRRSKKRRKGRREDDLKAGSANHSAQKEEVINKNILCSHERVTPLPVSEILHGNNHKTKTPEGVHYGLPFHNIKCRARVRVVDFFPHRLEDFAVAYYPTEDGSSANEQTPPEPSDEARRWEWRFYLLVEDGKKKTKASETGEKDKIKVLVADKDADQLLNMRAENLRQNDDALGCLREKLFLLWGDLEERKTAMSKGALRDLDPNAQLKAAAAGSERPEEAGRVTRVENHSSTTFECCLMEYGVKARNPTGARKGNEEEDDDGSGWERRFRMFGTTIL